MKTLHRSSGDFQFQIDLFVVFYFIRGWKDSLTCKMSFSRFSLLLLLDSKIQERSIVP